MLTGCKVSAALEKCLRPWLGLRKLPAVTHNFEVPGRSMFELAELRIGDLPQLGILHVEVIGYVSRPC